jgi:hypothetical protein
VIHAVLSGRIILNMRQVSSHWVNFSPGNTEVETLSALMLGENSRWQFRRPGVSDASDLDDIPLEELGGLEDADDAVSSERPMTNEGLGLGESQGARESMTAVEVRVELKSNDDT